MVIDLLSAVLLGILEGLTEFIPVSSTGHLIILSDLIGFSEERSGCFEVFIQLGAILAVVKLYPQKFRSLIDFKSKNKFSGKQGLLKLFVATAPALFFGFLFYDSIKKYLFTPQTVAYALFFGGIVLVFIEKVLKNYKKDNLEEVTYRDCLLVGIFQCFAMWPGLSRSGSTIVGGMILGLNKKLAAEFSFFLAVPVMVAAVGYDLLKSFSELTMSDIPIFAVGFIVSYYVAVFAIKFFIKFLSNNSLAPLGIYRIILGLLVYFLV